MENQFVLIECFVLIIEWYYFLFQLIVLFFQIEAKAGSEKAKKKGKFR